MSSKTFNNTKINVEFDEDYQSRTNINSGENISSLFAKIRRFMLDLKAVAFSGSYIDLSDKPTTATTTTDGLMSAADKAKLDGTDNKYALKSKYGDTTIDVGRAAGTTVGEYSTAEGLNTNASGMYSHAEGVETNATEQGCHAEGWDTTASGYYSHAEGTKTNARGHSSHAGGYFTNALHNYEVACGVYNKSNNDTLFSIGDGTSEDTRHNAFEITKTGGKLHDKDIATVDDIPTSLPANGGNADTVNNHTVNSDVPANAVFTDTWRGVQDNLTSDSAEDSLSANQGKILNEKIVEHTDNGDVHVTMEDKENWNSHPNDVTASGNPVTLDGLQGGVPFSEMAMSGKNLMPFPYYDGNSKTHNGITFTVNADGSVTANGTATAAAIFYISTDFTIKKGMYTLSGCPKSDSNTDYILQFATGDWSFKASDFGNGATILIDNDINLKIFRIAISNGVTVDNVVFRPQLEFGSTATEYEPPITGRELTVNVNGTDYTITPDSNPYVIPNDIRQADGLNNISVSEGEISVVGVRKNAAIKNIWDKIDELTTAIIVSNGESE